jgi:arylsulfatase A-like enzyme
MKQGSDRQSTSTILRPWRRKYLVSAAIALLGWAITAIAIIPWTIRRAYAGESVSFINRLITGQHQTPVEGYLSLWSRTAWLLTAALVAAIVFGYAALNVISAVRRGERLVRPAVPGLPGLPNATSSDVFLFAVWTGILAGLAEAINGIVRHRLEHLPTGEVVSGELFWMAPLAAVAAFVWLALVIVLVARVVPQRVDLRRLAPILFIALGIYSLTRALAIGVANLAAIALSIGVAVFAGRFIAGSGPQMRRAVRRSTPWMVGALVLWSVAVPVWRRLSEGRAVADLPAPPPNAPNVVVLIWDTVRALSTSLGDSTKRTTPELTRLASQGVAFERAFATSSWSLPSHASIFTGRYPHEMSVGHRAPLDGTHPTLAEVLATRGYVTGGFTANLFYGSADYGIARGFSWYDSRPAIKPSVIAHTWWLMRISTVAVRRALGEQQTLLRRHADHVNESFLSWQSRHRERPFFAVLNHFSAHGPYLPPSHFTRTRGTRRAADVIARLNRTDSASFSAESRAARLAAYEFCIEYLDFELGRLVTALRERGLLDNTILVVTADHGEEFGEHGAALTGHAGSLYAPVLHVPMVIAFPGRRQTGVRRHEVVSIADIPATVMDAIGAGSEHPFPGTSLLRYASSEVSPAEASRPRLAMTERYRWPGAHKTWPSSAGDMFSLFAEGHHYILDAKGGEQLYDHGVDVWEKTNLAARQDRAPILARSRQLMDSLVPRIDGVRHARAQRPTRAVAVGRGKTSR